MNNNKAIEELEREIKELQKEYCKLEELIKESSNMEECLKAESRISELEKELARKNRAHTEESVKAFYSRNSQAQHGNVKLDESLLPSDVDDNDSEGASASFGFHKRNGNECQF